MVLCEDRPPPRGAIEWAAAQVAPPRLDGRRAAKRQRLSADASADGASASVDSSSGLVAGRELDEIADSSAAGAAGDVATAAEAAGRVVAGIVRRGPDQELLVQVSQELRRGCLMGNVCGAERSADEASRCPCLPAPAVAAGAARRASFIMLSELWILTARSHCTLHPSHPAGAPLLHCARTPPRCALLASGGGAAAQHGRPAPLVAHTRQNAHQQRERGTAGSQGCLHCLQLVLHVRWLPAARL